MQLVYKLFHLFSLRERLNRLSLFKKYTKQQFDEWFLFLSFLIILGTIFFILPWLAVIIFTIFCDKV